MVVNYIFTLHHYTEYTNASSYNIFLFALQCASPRVDFLSTRPPQAAPDRCINSRSLPEEGPLGRNFYDRSVPSQHASTDICGHTFIFSICT